MQVKSPGPSLEDTGTLSWSLTAEDKHHLFQGVAGLGEKRPEKLHIFTDIWGIWIWRAL